MSYNRCKDIHKFGNKYLPLAYKTQVEFRSHFSGKKVRLMVREIWYFKIHTKLLAGSGCCGNTNRIFFYNSYISDPFSMHKV